MIAKIAPSASIVYQFLVFLMYFYNQTFITFYSHRWWLSEANRSMALCERANGAVAEFMAIKFLDTHRVLHIISTATTLTPSYVGS